MEQTPKWNSTTDEAAVGDLEHQQIVLKCQYDLWHDKSMKPNNLIFKNPKLIALMTEYSESHQNPTNQFIHKIAVPTIMLSLLGLIKSIPCAVDLSYVFLVLCFAYYAHFKEIRVIGFASIMILPMILILEWMRPNLFIPSAVLFLVAWVAQFYGHHVEGKKPSFLKDVSFLLIGPLWVTQSLYGNKQK